MAGKIFLRNKNNLRLISGGMLFLIIVSVCLSDDITDINRVRENVFSLIDGHKFDEARTAAEQLATEFAGDPNLPETKYQIGARYERVNGFEEEKYIFREIIRSHPDSPFAVKARMGISRAEIMSLITSEKFDRARAAIDVMISDFNGQPDLPEDLFWITERYLRVDNFEEAKANYRRIIENFPANRFADKSKLLYSRADATSLIMSCEYEKAQNVIDRMCVDFSGDSDLPMTLYWTAERLERMNRFEQAKQNYQRIVQNFPDNYLVDRIKLNVSWADRAKLGVARNNVMALIVSNEFDKAREALDKMVEDFDGNPALPATLYWLNEKYEWADKLDEAKAVYQQIIRKFPDSIYAERARLGLRRVAVMELMNLPDGNLAGEAIDKMIADFKDNSEMPRAVLIVGAKCFLDAKAPDYLHRAIRILEKVLYGLPKTDAMAGVNADAYCCAGDCYFALGDYDKALWCYQKVLSEYTAGYVLSAHAQYKTGLAYEKLADKGAIPATEAKKQTRLSYEQLLSKYPNCKDANTAKSWLAENQNK